MVFTTKSLVAFSEQSAMQFLVRLRTHFHLHTEFVFLWSYLKKIICVPTLLIGISLITISILIVWLD